MRYLSTGRSAPAVDFRTALLTGLAPDGGLYLPETVPQIEFERLARNDLASTATAVLAPYVDGCLEPGELHEMIADALDFPIPLVAVADDLSVLELFHGPTLAFKDVAARTMARLMARLRDRDRPLTVLVATSGDTGSAVAQAFWKVAGTRVVVLYPDGRVSPLQERQFATLGHNVTAVAVSGSFDDCQRLAKAAFGNPELAARHALTSANSINIGRLLPQVAYWVHAATLLDPDERPPLWCVPSGNLGNLTAGLLAWRSGLPATGFVAATNVNDVVPEYFETGIARPRPAVATISNAMDVGDPSNLVRIRALFVDDLGALRRVVGASRWDDDATRGAIEAVHRATGYVLDPHTAVGWLALRERLDRAPEGVHGVLLATAHPAKFGDVVAAAVGSPPPLPDRLAACLDRELRSVRIAAEPSRLACLLDDLD